MPERTFCYTCGGEIIFRGNPPQKYHLDSGWECWHESRGTGAVNDGPNIPEYKPPAASAPASLPRVA